jgi:hypothetical protein
MTVAHNFQRRPSVKGRVDGPGIGVGRPGAGFSGVVTTLVNVFVLDFQFQARILTFDGEGAGEIRAVIW